VSQDPKMTVIPHFLSEFECAHLISLVEGCWMPSLVAGAQSAKDLENKMSTTRTSWSCMTRYSQTEVLERIEHRLASTSGIPLSQLERMNMVRYAPGEEFGEHHDGAFRERTVFIYLNDLGDDDDAGDTFFPVLGLSFKPRCGTAVMWGNAQPDGKEDSRMLHAGRPPNAGVKYGVNCFINKQDLRTIRDCAEVPLDSASIVNFCDLTLQPGDVDGAAGKAKTNESAEEPQLVLFSFSQDPEIKAAPGFLTAAEVEHFLEQARNCDLSKVRLQGAFPETTQTLKVLEAEGTPTILSVEQRLEAISSSPLDYLARLRIVRPGTQHGLCNRGCGHTSLYICLSQQDELFFPRMGLRFKMRSGDLLLWKNLDFSTGAAAEDFRTIRVHRGQSDTDAPVFGLDAFFHDNPIRVQQKGRDFAFPEL